MSDVITGVGGSIASPSWASDRSTMGQADFLSLLVSQLRNQDPLSPLEPQEFASQLAGFSTVEQLSQLNAGLTEEIAASRTAAVLSQTTFGAALIGRRVLAEGNQVAVGPDGSGEITVDVGGGGGDATLTIFDESGDEVASIDVGAVESGRRTIALPDDLDAGTYSYELSVTDANGAAVSVTPFVSGIVDRLLFEDGTIQLCLGDIRIGIDALVEVAPATRAQV
jgi:flagellar basal-body rod modification protein FlgD